MSVISSRAAEPSTEPAQQAEVPTNQPTGMLIDLALAVFCAAMLVFMLLWHGQETVPYHFLFLSIALVYGFRVWPLLPTVVVILAVTALSGAILYGHYREGSIDSTSELAEIPLMSGLLAAMVWHARRRSEAQRHAESMAELRRLSIEREREFFRDTSHAIRTPVTIARGHLELIEDALPDTLARQDVGVALRQLDRLSTMSNRLLALAQLDSGVEINRARVDLASFVSEIGAAWMSSADRSWSVLSAEQPAWLDVDCDLLAMAVDALVENAVRFTVPGDEISITGEVLGTSYVISVADRGPGLDPADLPHLFERFWHRRALSGEMGSGLGLSMARAAARVHGGDVVASTRVGGGALIEIRLPSAQPPGGVASDSDLIGAT